MIAGVTLERSGLRTSRLGLGTSRFHHMRTQDRDRLVDSALDLGIRHIDTAPSYGDTLAECELGRILGRRRADVVLATKFGIPANPMMTTVAALAPPLRAARALGRRAGLFHSKPRPMTAEDLKASVAASMRNLKTDWIDLLLLHEPSALTLPNADDVLRALEDLKGKGVIRYFGLGGEWTGIATCLEACPALGQVVQTHEHKWPTGSVCPDITYGAISPGPQSATLRKSVGTTDATARLQQALQRRPHGVVIVSSTSPDRFANLAKACAQVTI